MIHGLLDNHRNYAPLLEQPVWQQIFGWLKALPENTAEGRYELGPTGLYARVMRYSTKPRQGVRFESHRRFIDVQCSLQGGERILWLPVGGMTPDSPYNEADDFQFYHDREAGTVIDNQPGRFTILFPADAHAPMLADSQHEEVLKVVVKVPVALVLGA